MIGTTKKYWLEQFNKADAESVHRYGIAKKERERNFLIRIILDCESAEKITKLLYVCAGFLGYKYTYNDIDDMHLEKKEGVTA